MTDEAIAVYDSLTPEYHRAFEIFLNHTDQKLKAQQWLNDLVDRLPCKDIFIDAGAGNGKVTAWFTERFGRTIAIEPNASLRSELTRACPAAEVVGEGILDAKVSAAGDLILCSHVFYYIDASEWMATLEQLVSWPLPADFSARSSESGHRLHANVGAFLWSALPGPVTCPSV
jgi:trans-aconitate methyltransferase